MVDKGFTYGTARRQRASFYVPKGTVPPEKIQVTIDGDPVEFVLLSDRSLECVKELGGCGKVDCHRLELGHCHCGHHEFPVPFRREHPL